MRAGRAAGTLSRAVASCFALGALASAAPASAWTEARIESAAAHVDVLDAQRVRVSLELGVRVDGGWLTRLELRGLEPELVLDPDKPPYVLCEDGRKVAPSVRRDAHGLVLGFPDAGTAPRRGRHLLGMVYEAPLTTLDAAGAAPTAVWGLPAFLHDLREARIELRAPAGSLPVQRGDEAPGTLSTRARRDHTAFALHAEHVPRGIPLELAFLRPGSASGPSPAASPERVAAAAHGGLALAALCAWLLGMLKLQASRRLAATQGARARPLLLLPAPARPLASAAACAAFAALYPAAPGWGLFALALAVALCIDRGFERRPQGAPAPWPQGAARLVALGRARRARAARLLGSGAWLDATTPAGATLLASAWALALARPADVWLELLLAITPLMLTATRLQLPPGRHDALIAHLRAASTLKRRRRVEASRDAAAPASSTPECPGAQPAPSPADADRRAPDRAA